MKPLDKDAAELHCRVLSLSLLLLHIVILCVRKDYVVCAHLISALWGFIVLACECCNFHPALFIYFYRLKGK